MQAVLFVGHGSRMQAGVQEAIQFIEKCKPMIDVPIQEVCFLELTAPNIIEGIANCVERGANKIAVIPILLLAAKHAKEDIPFEIEVAKTLYPDIEFTYGKVFGIHPKIITSLYERVIEQNVEVSEDAYVLLVGRGSSDPAVKHDLTKIAQLLKSEYSFKAVDVCFLYGAKPSFEEALLKLQQASNRQVFVIPYLLFTGILLNGIEKKIERQNLNGQRLILCESLGYHEQIQHVLVERVNELLIQTVPRATI
ncbi:sirohydrochlorin chelatase [Sporosarcina sp. HYO08]|uniref:sirohydrochlorin chelatase n=1 Tax=Sporosarcina sp. HYO08 TaxID=1759557 RepID=UPI000792B35E|nr:sirohydrochlorin chelatase [Sporosarcina sp. HYO08]KXH81793.1 sirohydrochlorin ferrochelatase [Sporosarcina sp. HYO08]